MKSRAVSRVVGFLLLILSGCKAVAASTNGVYTQNRLTFVSHGKTIRVDEFVPTSPGPHPAALVLHGAGGMLFDGPEMRRMARQLAASGVRAEVIHYFNGSGRAFTFDDAVLRAHFDEWLLVVRDAVDFARSRADPGGRLPAGIYGYSMGAFLGIAASADNPQVAALVEQAGGVWDGRMDRLGRLPPLLMIHGRADHRVPFEKYTVPLEKIVDRRGTGCRTYFIGPEGHGFSREAQQRARGVTAEFMRSTLSGAKPVSAVRKPGHTSRGKTIQP